MQYPCITVRLQVYVPASHPHHAYAPPLLQIHGQSGNLNGDHPSARDPSLHAVVQADTRERLEKAVGLLLDILSPTNTQYEAVKVVGGGSAVLRPVIPADWTNSSRANHSSNGSEDVVGPAQEEGELERDLEAHVATSEALTTKNTWCIKQPLAAGKPGLFGAAGHAPAGALEKKLLHVDASGPGSDGGSSAESDGEQASPVISVLPHPPHLRDSKLSRFAGQLMVAKPMEPQPDPEPVGEGQPPADEVRVWALRWVSATLTLRRVRCPPMPCSGFHGADLLLHAPMLLVQAELPAMHTPPPSIGGDARSEGSDESATTATRHFSLWDTSGSPGLHEQLRQAAESASLAQVQRVRGVGVWNRSRLHGVGMHGGELDVRTHVHCCLMTLFPHIHPPSRMQATPALSSPMPADSSPLFGGQSIHAGSSMMAPFPGVGSWSVGGGHLLPYPQNAPLSMATQGQHGMDGGIYSTHNDIMHNDIPKAFRP
jgi:hypothetical protein